MTTQMPVALGRMEDASITACLERRAFVDMVGAEFVESLYMSATAGEESSGER